MNRLYRISQTASAHPFASLQSVDSQSPRLNKWIARSFVLVLTRNSGSELRKCEREICSYFGSRRLCTDLTGQFSTDRSETVELFHICMIHSDFPVGQLK